MFVQVSQEQGRVPVTVFHIEGEIAANSAESLQEQAEEAFEAGTRHLLLDLSDTTYLSSSGLRALHHIFMMLRSDDPQRSDEVVRKGIAAGTYKSSHLKLLNPSRNVLRVLSQSGYDMFLEIHARPKQAIASF